MAKQIPEDALTMIESVLRQQDRPLPVSEILQALPASVPLRTLQHRLKSLVSGGRVAMEGRGRWAKYRLPRKDRTDVQTSEDQDAFIPLSGDAREVRDYVRRASHVRRPVGYDRDFLDGYRPNVAFYLTEKERAHLAQIGRPQFSGRPAGTYARHILNRLLIDLAWNSSRLEGNTYSLLVLSARHETPDRIWRGSRRARRLLVRPEDRPHRSGALHGSRRAGVDQPA